MENDFAHLDGLSMFLVQDTVQYIFFTRANTAEISQISELILAYRPTTNTLKQIFFVWINLYTLYTVKIISLYF